MTPLSRHLRAGLLDARWANIDLWVATLALGTSLELADIDAITSGATQPTAQQYGTMACALNERLADLGLDHPMAAWPDLPDRTS